MLARLGLSHDQCLARTISFALGLGCSSTSSSLDAGRTAIEAREGLGEAQSGCGQIELPVYAPNGREILLVRCHRRAPVVSTGCEIKAPLMRVHGPSDPQDGDALFTYELERLLDGIELGLESVDD